MTGITGMEVARKIREQDTHCQLIFTTTTGEFAVDSYEVGAAYYLVKPFSYENLTQALSRCSAELLEQSQCVIIPGATEQPPLPSNYLYRIPKSQCRGSSAWRKNTPHLHAAG